jgi:transcriptional regulator with GAF, ATPase, and Fis domain
MRFDERKPVLSPQQVELLPEFAPLNLQQKKFVLLLAGGAPAITSVKESYACKNPGSARAFAYDIMKRRSLQPILNRLYGGQNDDAILEKVEELISLLSLHVECSRPLKDETIVVPDYLAEANYRDARRKFETAYLKRKLEEHRWNVSKTAAEVGLHRQSLQEKLRELGLQRPVK